MAPLSIAGFGRWEDSDILVPLVALSNGAETTIILLSPGAAAFDKRACRGCGRAPSRRHNPTGLGERFETSRDIHTVAEDIVLLNDHRRD